MTNRMTLKEYTQETVKYNPSRPVTWVTAEELLDLLNRVEAGDAAQAKLAAIEAEEELPSDLMEEHPVDEPDYGDLEPGQDVLETATGFPGRFSQ